MEVVTVLFIGAGNITFGNDNVLWNHSLRIEACLGPNLEVSGIIDPLTERVKQVLAQKKASAAASCYRNTHHFCSITEGATHLRKNGIVPRLIILATPPHLRGTMLEGRNLEMQIISAFGSSPAIFCEKPVSMARPIYCLPVSDLLQQSGNTVSVGYMLRYLKVVQKAISIIQENKLQVMAVNARYTCAYSRVRKVDWWNKSKQGGPIVEQATHFCDLCRYLGGEVQLDSVKAYELGHEEPAGKLSNMAVDESQIPSHDRVPRVTTAFWKFDNGGLGSLTHLIALHGIRYSNEIVVTADGYQLRLMDLYTTPTLYVRTPASEKEEVFAYPNDDPFYSEFAVLLNTISTSSLAKKKEENHPSEILSSYTDACKTYDFTWRIRDESEKSSEALRLSV